MAEFSRIRVTPAEEEDIVILAGAVEEPFDVVSDGIAVQDATPEEASVAEDVPSVASRENATVYEETTLEDLQRTSMSGIQKAILALAIVAVVAFIIWYVFLR